MLDSGWGRGGGAKSKNRIPSMYVFLSMLCTLEHSSKQMYKVQKEMQKVIKNTFANSPFK
jgi:hypothetical protein